MNLVLRTGTRRFLEETDHIVSFLLTDPHDIPVLFGVEYPMQSGSAWTIAHSRDSDFYRLLEDSGILHSLCEGSRQGQFNLFCQPSLGQGVPRWYSDVSCFAARNSNRIPFFLAYEISRSEFRGLFYNTPEFQTSFQKIISAISSCPQR